MQDPQPLGFQLERDQTDAGEIAARSCLDEPAPEDRKIGSISCAFAHAFRGTRTQER